MEKVAQKNDHSIGVKGLAVEVNGTLNRFADLLREAPPWLRPICEPGKDWKVLELKNNDYMTVLNALVIGNEEAANREVNAGMRRFSRITALYDETVRAAERTGRIKAFDKAQRVLHNKAYWETNNDAHNRSGLAKYLRASLLSDGGSVLLRARLANDAEVLARLIAVKDVGFAGKQEYMEYAIRRVEPWLEGFGVGGYSQNGTYMFYVKGSEQEKNGWLESHQGYMDRVEAFLAELRSSCADSETLPDSGAAPMHAILRYEYRKEKDQTERRSAFRHL